MTENIEERLRSTATKYSIDWGVSTAEDFRRQVRDFIQHCQDNNKVIPLPVYLGRNDELIGTLALLLSQVNCDSCDALCCRQRVGTEDTNGIDVFEGDLKLLGEIGEAKHVTLEDGHMYLKHPCPFVCSIGKNHCTIYPSRPITCILFPFQGGGWDAYNKELVSVASSCPEGRRIARNTYMMAWRLRQRFTTNFSK